ncbi:DNA-binding SARP family transcriptional activator [Actinoplanes teichomyceticus]|uniref:DNA-binding SARP family transcriptional activator n=1 Tax=Actinoplanes teichomyceticus TaxID=1867 RepID=A0A561VG79_ACTTI|nr:DNA-binding SARP family transcriptional activator [Actinoplanes teichomyceticus]
MEPEPRFEILGALRAFRGADPIDLGPAKQRAVLAVLLLHPGRAVPTHRIVDAVWGEDPPENGTNVVQKYVAGLRRALGRERLTLTGGGYLLCTDPHAVDAEVFRAEIARAVAEHRAGRNEPAAGIVADALALWHGDALDGLTGPLFDTARARLAEDRAGAWELWAQLGLARDDPGLVPELTRLTGEFPLREGLRAQLMIALYRAGRQAEALAVFRDAREYFLDELGAEPGERMQQVHRRILRGELEQPAPPHPAPPAPRTGHPAAPGSPAPPHPAPPAPRTGHPAAPGSPAPPHPAPPAPRTGHPAAPGSPAPPHPLWPIEPLPTAMLRPGHGRIPWLQVVAAAALPLFTCGFAGWVYFVYAAVQRGRRRHLLVAALYAALAVFVVVMFAVDPTPVESETTSAAEDIAVLSMLLLWPASAVHGAILAAHPGDTRSARARRDLARRFAGVHPAGAVQAGIGRPDLLRFFDDGGLVDLNHAPAQELARLPGMTPFEAHRIALDRYQNGPYRQPADLATRGLLAPAKLRRIESWLLCLPPGQQPAPAG